MDTVSNNETYTLKGTREKKIDKFCAENFYYPITRFELTSYFIALLNIKRSICCDVVWSNVCQNIDRGT